MNHVDELIAAKAAEIDELEMDVRCRTEPTHLIVRGAGVALANGEYKRDGKYKDAACFKKGGIWIIRYTMPSGNKFWYIADSTLLDKDDGDLYRAKSAAEMPPWVGWRLARDGKEPAPTIEGVCKPTARPHRIPPPDHNSNRQSVNVNVSVSAPPMPSVPSPGSGSQVLMTTTATVPAGQPMLVSNASGMQFNVIVPAGVKSGESFTFSMAA